MSPITIARSPMGTNAAHDPSPAAGASRMPSTVTGTSARAQPIFTAPSSWRVASTPAALPIAAGSSAAPMPGEAITAEPKKTASIHIGRASA